MRLPGTVVACGLLALSAEPHGQVFKSTVDMVSIGVTVVDKRGALATDLTAGDFGVYEDGQRQELRLFARGDQTESTPDLHLGLLFDTSGSMDEDIALSRTAAVKFLNALPQAADVTLVDFATEVRVARYGQNDFPRLIERIRRRKADGNTALYDALGVYLDGANTQDGRKIMVLYTDGGDTYSSLSFPEALDLIKASDITLYAVGFLQHQRTSVQLEQRNRIQRMVALTGGQAFFPMSAADLDAAYGKVLAEIKAQYVLGYLSANTRADGTWRKVDIKVSRPGLKLRSRSGYFAPFRAPR